MPLCVLQKDCSLYVFPFPFPLLAYPQTIAFQAGSVIKKSLSPNTAEIIKAIQTFNESVVSSKVLAQPMMSLESSDAALLENAEEVCSTKSHFLSAYTAICSFLRVVSQYSRRLSCLIFWMLGPAFHSHILTTQT